MFVVKKDRMLIFQYSRTIGAQTEACRHEPGLRMSGTVMTVQIAGKARNFTHISGDRMKTFTIEDIRSWEPCYDPAKYWPEGWSGTALDLLEIEKIPAADKLWLSLRENILSEKVLRLHAISSARAALALITNPHPDSINACDVSERFAHGQATSEELVAAWAASHAASDAASDAA